MKPVCVECLVEMKPEKNGVYIELRTPQPYQIWSGDMWKCPNCKRKVVSGYGRAPVAEHFDETLFRSFRPDLVVYDRPPVPLPFPETETVPTGEPI